MLHKTRKQMKRISAITLMLLLIVNIFVYAENSDDEASLDILQETVDGEEQSQELLIENDDNAYDISNAGDEEIVEIEETVSFIDNGMDDEGLEKGQDSILEEEIHDKA